MKLKDLKTGSFFTLKEISEPSDFQVWVREYYDRENKVYVCHNYSDVNRFRSFKGDKEVFVDFIF